VSKEKVKFLREVAKTEKEEDGIKVMSVTKKDYTTYLKKFHGVTTKMLDQIAEAKSDYLNVSTQVAGEELLNNMNISQCTLKTRTEEGMVKVKVDREKTYHNPRTGEPIKTPQIDFDVKIRSMVDKNLLEEMKEKIKKQI